MCSHLRPDLHDSGRPKNWNPTKPHQCSPVVAHLLPPWSAAGSLSTSSGRGREEQGQFVTRTSILKVLKNHAGNRSLTWFNQVLPNPIFTQDLILPHVHPSHCTKQCPGASVWEMPSFPPSHNSQVSLEGKQSSWNG